MTSNRGVLYLAIGSSYVEEARRSATSIRQHMDVPIAIVTTADVECKDDFDHVIVTDRTRRVERSGSGGETWLWDSTIDPGWSPFEKTLYLDTDTRVCDDLSPLFELLDRYELAVARLQMNVRIESLPEPIQQHYNTGVIAYRDTPAVETLFNRWQRVFRDRAPEQEKPLDQPAFAEAMYATGVDFVQLPMRYNIRLDGHDRVGTIAGEPKILHGRDDLERAEHILRGNRHQQVYRGTVWGAPLTLRRKASSRTEELVYRLLLPVQDLKYSLKNDPIDETTRKFIERIRAAVWPG